MSPVMALSGHANGRPNVCFWGDSGHGRAVSRCLLMTHTQPGPGADICRVARDLQNCAAQTDVIADFRLLRATPYPEGRLGGTNRLRRDLARNIAAYPAFLPILLSLQEGLFFSLYLARFSRNQR